MNHIRLQAPATADLRDLPARLPRGRRRSPRYAHTPEMRRPESGAGRYNIPNIGIFLWRLVSLAPDGAAAGRRSRRCQRPQVPRQSAGRRPAAFPPRPHRGRHQPSRRADQRARAPVGAADGAGREGRPGQHRAGTGRRARRRLRHRREPGAAASRRSADAGRPSSQIRICDLRDIVDGGGAVIGWNHEAAVPAGTIGVDPERGRVLLGAPADGPLLATFHYGSVRDDRRRRVRAHAPGRRAGEPADRGRAATRCSRGWTPSPPAAGSRSATA